MKAMKMPEFTAEASLFRMAKHCWEKDDSRAPPILTAFDRLLLVAGRSINHAMRLHR